MDKLISTIQKEAYRLYFSPDKQFLDLTSLNKAIVVSTF